MKKGIVIALAVILCSLTASCSSDLSLETKPSAQTLTIAARDGSLSDVIIAVKDDFEITHNCTINVIPLGADEIHANAIADATHSTGMYDIIMIDDPLMPEYIEKNVICNITQLGYIDDEDFVEKSRLLGKDPYPLGATYSLPFSGNVQLIFYNSELIGDDCDLSSWNSILKLAQTVNQTGKVGYALRGQTGNPIVSDFLPILWAFGGEIFDESGKVIINSPQSAEALEFYCQLLENGQSYEKNDLINAITNGDAAIALGWPSWFITENGPSASIAEVPGKKDASSTVLPTGEIGNWLLGITSNSANKELSLECIKYLTSENVQEKALSYGGIPTRISIFKNKKTLEKYPFFSAIYSGTNNSRVRPRTTKWSRIEEVFGAELVKCIDGEQSIEDTLINSQNAIEALANE